MQANPPGPSVQSQTVAAQIPLSFPTVRDRRTSPADQPVLRGQNRQILDALRNGPKTGPQLHAVLCSLDGTGASAWRTRTSDVRLWLERHTGETITARRLRRGLYLYEIVRKPEATA